MVIHPGQSAEGRPLRSLLDVTREIPGNRAGRDLRVRGVVPSKSELAIILDAAAQSSFDLEQQAKETFLRTIRSRIAQTDASRTGTDIIPGGDFHQRSPSKAHTIHALYLLRTWNLKVILKILEFYIR
jgi:hypothetical protein